MDTTRWVKITLLPLDFLDHLSSSFFATRVLGEKSRQEGSGKREVADFITTIRHSPSQPGEKNSTLSPWKRVTKQGFILRRYSIEFKRSGQIVSKHFHSVLRSVVKLHSIILSEPQPVPEDNTDTRWGCFKGCLGALDGTYVDVQVHNVGKLRYINRKGQVTVNVLGVCDMNMKFVYVLTGWEGSAADSQVLRDAINRPHGLRVPKGNYYLCDNGYPNCEGFLTPYKGVRYHLNEWSSRRPQNYQEYLNMKHIRA
ncbi:hypothetical protein ACS0TY_014647 [Phlomoides rotata]